MRKKWNLKPVEIWWRDSTVLKSYWQNFNDGMKTAESVELLQRSIGMLVEKNKDRIIISQSIGIEGENIFGQMGGFLIIPREAVINIKRLVLKEKN